MSGDNGASERKKKTAIIGVSSVLLIAMVAAVAVGGEKNEEAAPAATSSSSSISASQKNVDTICTSAEYKSTCEKSLEKAVGPDGNADMKTLVKAAFNSTVEELHKQIHNSKLYNDLAKDPKTKDALEVCKQVFGLAINSLNASIEKVDKFDVSKINEYAYDLQVWLQAAITHQHTCLDGFQDTNTTESGQKMAKVLKKSLELSNNALDIVNGMSEVFKGFNFTDFKLDNVLAEINGDNKSRKLLSSSSVSESDPTWINHHQRKLIRIGNKKKVKPDVVVAQDGRGKFKTLTEALKTVPPMNKKPYVIYVRAGVYKENIELQAYTHDYVTIIGDGPTKTIFSGSKNNREGITTWSTATFAVNSVNFMAVNVGFENTAGAEKGQAVALRVSGDKAVIYKCNVDGNQDTLYANSFRQFYRDVNVWGTIDFVFGGGEAVFQNCTFLLRKSLPGQELVVAAGGKDRIDGPSALVFQYCNFTADPSFSSPTILHGEVQVYLARPWKQYAKTVIIDSYIDGVYNPKGYLAFIGNDYHQTCTVMEANNKGPNGDVAKRVMWPGSSLRLTPAQVSEYYPGKFYQLANAAEGDSWIVHSGVPYSLGPMAHHIQ